MAAPIEIKECEKFGRFLAATKDIPAGQEVFKETPIFEFSRHEKTEHNKDYFTCVSCFRVFKSKEKKRFQCKNCNWPICGRRCSKDGVHRHLECEVLAENSVRSSNRAIRYVHLVRILQMKVKDKLKWDKLLSLFCNFGVRNPDGDYIHDCSKAHRFLKTKCKLDVSLSLVKQINYCIDGHGYYSDFDDEPESTCTVYPNAGFLAHSCSPSLDWDIDSGKKNERGTISFIARRDICAGEMITFAYSYGFCSEGTHQRRASILRDCNFLCLCERCEDPTELGTYFSAIACPRCPNGWLLPSFRSMYEIFICDKCNYISEEDAPLAMMSFKTKMNGVCKEIALSQKKCLDELIANATVEYKLHPNHRLVIIANELWIQAAAECDILMESSPESETMFQKIIDRAEQNIQIANLFGTISQKFHLHCTIAKTFARYYFKSRDYISICEDISNLDEKIATVETIVKHFSVIDVANPLYFGESLKEFAPIARKMYAKWISRLAKYRAKSMKQNNKY